MRLTRRTALLGMGAAITYGHSSFVFAQADTARRFIVVLMRGGLDGLSAVVPYGDPDLRRWRAELVPPNPGANLGLLDLDGFWGLHPSLSRLHDFYNSGELLPVHAVAGPNRSRSHFEAQDIMEVGADHRITSGWLNRVAALIPPVLSGENSIAVGDSLPLLLRGPAPIATWDFPDRRSPETNFYAQFSAMHSADRLTGPSVIDGLRERGFTDAALAGKDPAPPRSNGFPRLAHAAGRLLATADGPRIAVIETEGDWDTHGGQVPRLSQSLATLDEGLAELKSGLGGTWSRSVVLVMTEFGRTVKVNGTHGTDHGTAGVALVMGGAVAGGRVQADWPGMAEHQLFESRDLQPTTDIRELAKGLLSGHLGLGDRALAEVFPDSESVRPLRGMLRT
jgi:uncharacterized protein (DUF1501 family)